MGNVSALQRHEPRRVLITGGAGFVGAHLAQRCLDRGDEVHLLVRKETSLARVLPILAQLHVHCLSFGDHNRLHACLAAVEPDDIYHLAVTTRGRVQPDFGDLSQGLDDLSNLMRLVSAAATLRRPPRAFIRCGSLAEYGTGPVPAVESQREAPTTAYAASLVAGTHYLQGLAGRLPFRALTARLALVYGPGQSEAFFIPDCLRRLREARPVTVQRPSDRRDLVHVADVVEGLLTLAAAPHFAGNVANICTGYAPTMHDVAVMIAMATKADPSLVELSGNAPAEPVSHLECSPLLVATQTGWKARIGFAQGLTDLVATAAATRVLEECL